MTTKTNFNEKRHFRRNDLSVPVDLVFSTDTSRHHIKAKTINLGNGGALLRTIENINKYKGEYGHAQIAIKEIWRVSPEESIEVSFRLLRVESEDGNGTVTYKAAIQFFLLSPPIDPEYLTTHLNAGLISVITQVDNYEDFLSEILHRVRQVSSAEAGVLCIYDKATMEPNVGQNGGTIKIVDGLVKCICEGFDQNNLPPSFVSIQECPFIRKMLQDGSEVRVSLGGGCESMAQFKNAICYSLPISVNQEIRGVICLMVPRSKELEKHTIESLRNYLSQVPHLLDIIVDRSLQKGLLTLHASGEKLLGERPSYFMCRILKKAKDMIGCEGISFFVRDRSRNKPTFVLVASVPQSFPTQNVEYSLTDPNFSSWVLRQEKSSLLQNVSTIRRKLQNFGGSKWCDIGKHGFSKSSIFVPIKRGNRLAGLLRCTNKISPNSNFFNSIDLYRAKAVSSVLIALHTMIQEEYHLAESLIVISHEIKVKAAGIRSAANFIRRALIENREISLKEEDELLHKIAHIKSNVSKLPDLLSIRLIPMTGSKSVIKSIYKTLEEMYKSDMGFAPYADLCKPICEMHREAARLKNIQFKFQGEKQLGRIYASLEVFELIFGNLVSNAVKYTFEYNNITIVMMRVPLDNKFAFISIMSNSIPIRPEEAERIFEDGYRSAAAYSDAEGDGRGLFIARTMARELGGDVIFNSKNEINVFTISIPAKLFVAEKGG